MKEKWSIEVERQILIEISAAETVSWTVIILNFLMLYNNIYSLITLNYYENINFGEMKKQKIILSKYVFNILSFIKKNAELNDLSLIYRIL